MVEFTNHAHSLYIAKTQKPNIFSARDSFTAHTTQRINKNYTRLETTSNSSVIVITLMLFFFVGCSLSRSPSLSLTLSLGQLFGQIAWSNPKNAILRARCCLALWGLLSLLLCYTVFCWCYSLLLFFYCRLRFNLHTHKQHCSCLQRWQVHHNNRIKGTH